MGEFDFQSYVLKRRADISQKPVTVCNYAYIEDIERTRQISRNPLIEQAAQLGLEAWKYLRARRIQKSSKAVVSGERVARVWADVCYRFHHVPLPLRILPMQKNLLDVHGGEDGVVFTLSPVALVLPNGALQFLFGRGIGALDNGHVPWLTLVGVMDGVMRGMLRVAAQVADLALHWRVSAEITEDRAGILSCRDISSAIFVLMRMNLDWGDDEIMREIRRYHEGKKVDWGCRDVALRVKALELFMGSRIYVGSGGREIEEIDDAVKKLF